MALGDDDIPAMLAELGVDVFVQPGGAPAKGIIRQYNETELEFEGASQLLVRKVEVTIQTGSLGMDPGPVPGATLSIGGVDHKVVRSMALEHGRLTRIVCQVISQDWVDE